MANTNTRETELTAANKKENENRKREQEEAFRASRLVRAEWYRDTWNTGTNHKGFEKLDNIPSTGGLAVVVATSAITGELKGSYRSLQDKDGNYTKDKGNVYAIDEKGVITCKTIIDNTNKAEFIAACYDMIELAKADGVEPVIDFDFPPGTKITKQMLDWAIEAKDLSNRNSPHKVTLAPGKVIKEFIQGQEVIGQFGEKGIETNEIYNWGPFKKTPKWVPSLHGLLTERVKVKDPATGQFVEQNRMKHDIVWNPTPKQMAEIEKEQKRITDGMKSGEDEVKKTNIVNRGQIQQFHYDKLRTALRDTPLLGSTKETPGQKGGNDPKTTLNDSLKDPTTGNEWNLTTRIDIVKNEAAKVQSDLIKLKTTASHLKNDLEFYESELEGENSNEVKTELGNQVKITKDLLDITRRKTKDLVHRQDFCHEQVKVLTAFLEGQKDWQNLNPTANVQATGTAERVSSAELDAKMKTIAGVGRQIEKTKDSVTYVEKEVKGVKVLFDTVYSQTTAAMPGLDTMNERPPLPPRRP